MDRAERRGRGIPLRALVPNAITALALCSGLTGVRWAIEASQTDLAEHWERALIFVIIAALLDGMDGRIARMLKGQSRFGAEMDSLADSIAFGVSPAIILYLWSLQSLPKFGWIFALAHAVCAALRLARFNANIDVEDQPHKSAGFLTGVPAPAGAGLLFLPMFLWLWTEADLFRSVLVVAPWTALVAFLLVSNLATFSWGSFRLRRHILFWVLAVIALIGAALVSAPWPTLSVVAMLYVAMIPASIWSYAKVKRQRALRAKEQPAG
jgi:CDP-diacylglycerol--serine O-phosphatidyltransferase